MRGNRTGGLHCEAGALSLLLMRSRMDLHHELLLRLLNGELHTAPLKNPQRILDVGTGTGIWAIDVADRYPEAEVLGIDLSPIQPSW
jgi:ubiquinone/menaquinone biosynthesis C-methylase UbiE